MPYQVLTNWSKFKAGDIITGGDIAELTGCVGKVHGFDPVPATQRKKLGLAAPKKGVATERIKELIARGVLYGIGDDAVRQPDTPIILQPTFEERQAALAEWNKNPQTR